MATPKCYSGSFSLWEVPGSYLNPTKRIWSSSPSTWAQTLPGSLRTSVEPGAVVHLAGAWWRIELGSGGADL